MHFNPAAAAAYMHHIWCLLIFEIVPAKSLNPKQFFKYIWMKIFLNEKVLASGQYHVLKLQRQSTKHICDSGASLNYGSSIRLSLSIILVVAVVDVLNNRNRV